VRSDPSPIVNVQADQCRAMLRLPCSRHLADQVILPSLTRNFEKFYLFSRAFNTPRGERLTQSMSLTGGSACSFKNFQIGWVSGVKCSAEQIEFLKVPRQGRQDHLVPSEEHQGRAF
jgi:hypothetical protein